MANIIITTEVFCLIMGIIEDICVSISGIACRLFNGSKQDDTPMGPTKNEKIWNQSNLTNVFAIFSAQ